MAKSILSTAKDVSTLGQRNLWVIYGKSGAGKTHLAGTFPKPLLYLQIGDDGSNTIKDVEGIKALRINSVEELRTVSEELRLDTKYKTIVVDTFSMVVNEWIDQNATAKKKRVTQQMWGDLKVDTEQLIKYFHINALDKTVVLVCHEVADEAVDGFEDEILPDIRPSISKGARTYLEGMANYGIHCAILKKEKSNNDGTVDTEFKHSAHLGANAYYWTKVQAPSTIKLPKVIVNPSYKKIMKFLEVKENE